MEDETGMRCVECSPMHFCGWLRRQNTSAVHKRALWQQVGAFARCAVVAVLDSPPSGPSIPRLQLSLRPSRGGALAGRPTPPPSAPPCPELLQPDPAAAAGSCQGVVVGALLRGFVRASSARGGVFVSLDRATVARLRLSRLSDGFIEDPAAAFPVRGPPALPPPALPSRSITPALYSSAARRWRVRWTHSPPAAAAAPPLPVSLT
jgi:hypothetical protein